MNENQPLIRLENVTKYYTDEGGVGLGIHQINLSFNLGEFVIITGTSGSGKTTLLNVISGMDTYEEGTVWINGEDSTGYGTDEYENYRREYVSFIFQNYNLVDSFTVYQNIELALIAKGYNKQERKEKVLNIINEVGLVNRQNHKVTRLSGGEKQRVAIARALASDAPIIACDEITGNLDYQTSIEIIALLRKVSKGKLVLLVTHDPEEVIKYATRVITMHDGSVDKDYVNNDVYLSEEISINKAKKIKFKEIYFLGMKTLISTPKKFLFMLLFFMISSLLILFVYSMYNKIDTLFGNEYSFSFFYNNYSERIVLKKKNNEPFEENDYQLLLKNKRIKSIIKNDPLLDINVNVQGEEFVELFYFRSKNDINRTELTNGTISNNDNDIVLCSSDKNYENYVGKTIRTYLRLDKEIVEYNVTGFIYDIDAIEKYIYISNNVLDYYYLKTILVNSDFIMEDFVLSNFVYEPVFIIDNTIEENSFVFDFEFDYFNGLDKFNGKLIIQNKYFTKEIDNFNVYIKENNEKKVEDWNLIESFIPNDYIYCSEKTLSKLLDMNFYQISITIDDKNNSNLVANEMIELGYIPYECNWKNDAVSSLSSIPMIIIKVYVVIYLIIMFIGLSSLMYVILKNAVRSEQKSFLVMRSLGIDGKNIKIQLYCQLISISLISIISLFIIWFVVKINNFGYIGNLIRDLSVFKMLLISILVLLISLLLSMKYSNNIISKAIVSKEME